MNHGQVNLVGGSAYSSTGGIQAVNRMLVSELAGAGLLRRGYFLWDEATTATHDSRTFVKEDRVRFYGLNRWEFTKDIFGSALKRPRDFWLCTHVNYTLVGLCASFGRQSRVAVLLHAAEMDEAFTELKRLALCRAGKVFTVSEFTKKKALALGVRASRIHVIRNGVHDPCPEWEPTRYISSTETILFVGRMDERYKGQMELLDAMMLLRQRLPALRLVFVGGGSTLDEWKAESALRGLSERVEFTGRISDAELSRRYASAALFAMPSHNEGFGLVYAEAMAHGLPCLGSERDAAREVIVDGETGLCVPAGNSTALADAIWTLMRNPRLREEMSLAARIRFASQFTFSAHSQRMLAALEQWRVEVG